MILERGEHLKIFDIKSRYLINYFNIVQFFHVKDLD